MDVIDIFFLGVLAGIVFTTLSFALYEKLIRKNKESK